jgi:BirA family biotin operon repressor/biotin-[acetyl-CoA-carboxylase] ligase
MPQGLFGDVRRFDELDSTNRYLLDEARAGAPEGVVAVAGHQSAGRGRRGRTWEAPPGANLLVSVLLRPVLDVEDLYLGTVALCLAARAACVTTGHAPVTIKWPNDLLVGDRKVAGVLAEADFTAPGGPPGSVALVAGIGVNLRWGGPQGAGGTSLLVGGGVDGGPDALLDTFLAELEARRPLLDGPGGRRALADEFRHYCSTIGRLVAVDLGSSTVHGEAVGLSDQGLLLVRVDGETRPIAAGDVVHLRPMRD